MTTAKRILRNFLSLSVTEIISKIITFLATIYLARILEVENFGRINFASAIFAYFLLISNSGLMTLGTREVARNRGVLRIYVGDIIPLRLFLAAISFLLLVLVVFLIPKPLDVKFLIIFYGFSLFPLALSLEWCFQGIERMEFVGFARVLGCLVYFLLVIGVMKNSAQVLILPYLFLAGNAIASIFLFYVLIKKFGVIKYNFNPQNWWKLLKQASPMGFAWLMIQIYNNFDTVMLSFMKSDKEVGLYNAAYKIILGLFFIGGIYIISIFPVISKYYKESMEKLKTLLSYSAKLMIILGLPLGVGGMVLAKPIMDFFYGPQYDGGIIAFRILIWYVVVSFICMIYANSLLACNREKKYAMGVAFSAIINIGLNALLIPRFSLKGAAFATVVSEVVLLIYSYIEFNKIIKLEIKKFFLKPLFSAVLMGEILYLNMNKNLFLLIAIGIGVYVSGLFLTKGISKEDIKVIRCQLMNSKIV
ncbi:MAG: flippase [Candidatus Omnitrophica bacterium]|nr:flippase [Candidatus Omnitrophota bacterium]MBU4478288.1 flippase [Candidatus Omnitrophota bacterium]MCG2703356.1 flippase [Candidatus Omnitrophota bacterium]